MPSKVIDIRTRRPVNNVAEREAAQSAADGVALRLAVGCTVENGTLRTHRYRDHLVLWDLTNAGKRGKKVTTLNLTPSYTLPEIHRSAIMERIAILLEGLQSYAVAAAVLSELASVSKTIDLAASEARGIDVPPASFRPIIVRTEILEVVASYTDFTISCLSDKNNLPTAVPPVKHGKKSIPKFYDWVAANQDALKSMSYRQVLAAMMAQGIKFHDYCAMD